MTHTSATMIHKILRIHHPPLSSRIAPNPHCDIRLTLKTAGPSVKGFPLETTDRPRIDFTREMA